MTLFSLLLSAAVIMLAISGLTATGVWIFWVALALAVGAVVVAVTNNNRAVG